MARKPSGNPWPCNENKGDGRISEIAGCAIVFLGDALSQNGNPIPRKLIEYHTALEFGRVLTHPQTSTYFSTLYSKVQE